MKKIIGLFVILYCIYGATSIKAAATVEPFNEAQMVHWFNRFKASPQSYVQGFLRNPINLERLRASVASPYYHKLLPYIQNVDPIIAQQLPPIVPTPQTELEPTTQVEQEAAEIRAALEATQQLLAAETARANAAEQTKQSELAQIRQELTASQSQLDATLQQRSDVEQQLQTLQQLLAEETARADAAEQTKRSELAQIQQELTTKQAELSAALQQRSDIELQLQTTQQSLEVETARADAAEQTKKIELAQIQEELAARQSQLNDALQQRSAFEQQLQTIQQSLTQQTALAEQAKEKAQNEIAQLNEQISQKQVELESAQQRHEADMQQLLEQFQAEQDNLRKEHARQIQELVQEYQNRLAAADASQKSLAQELDRLKASKDAELDALQQQVQTQQSELERIKATTPISSPIAATSDPLQEKDHEIAQLRQQIDALAQENILLKQQASGLAVTPALTAAQGLLKAFQSRDPAKRYLQHHPLFEGLDLDKGTPTLVSFGDKKYRILNPNNPALQDDAEKYLADVPAPIATINEDQKLTKKQIASIQDLAEAQKNEQEQIEQVNTSKSAYLTAPEATEFLRIITPGVHVEGYCGQEFKDNGTIILYVAHGTWSNKAAFAGDIMTETSYNIFKFACQLALAEKKQIQVISVSWSGALSFADREEAATRLASDAITRIEQEKPSGIWVLAHSHGCNVAAMAANKVFDNAGKLLNVAIFLASPTLDIPKPLDFKTVYAFYSQGDMTQTAGSAQGAYNFNRKLPFATPEKLAEGRKVYNIRTQMDGYDLDHVSIKWGVVPHLAKILTYIDTYYPCNFDLEVDVQNKPNSLPLVALRRREPNCGYIDGKALAEDVRAKEEFLRRYSKRGRGDMSKMGVKYIRGLAWAFNFARETASAWKGEPTIGAEYLQEVTAAQSPTRPSSPQNVPIVSSSEPAPPALSSSIPKPVESPFPPAAFASSPSGPAASSSPPLSSSPPKSTGWLGGIFGRRN